MRMKVIAHTFFSKRLRIFLISSLSLLILPFQSIPSHAASLPSAPQYVEAMADVYQVAITWDAPGNNGGSQILITPRESGTSHPQQILQHLLPVQRRNSDALLTD